MENLHCVVAGGAGFIGSHLVEALLTAGDRVTVLDNFSSGSMDNLSHLEDAEHLAIHEVDITDGIPDLTQVDIVLHLASIANPTDYETAPLEVLRVNSEGNENLLRMAARTRARYVFFSSSEVYGQHEPMFTDGLSEESLSILRLNHRRSQYFVGKMFGEDLVRTFCQLSEIEHIIVRPFNVFGTRMDINTEYGRVIPNFIEWALKGEPLQVNGDGSQERAFIFIDDFIDCIMALLHQMYFRYEVLNVGYPESIRIGELALLVNRLTGNDAGVVFADRYEFEPKWRNPDIGRARSWLGWEPSISIEQGLRIMLDELNLEVRLK